MSECLKKSQTFFVALWQKEKAKYIRIIEKTQQKLRSQNSPQ